MLFSQGTLNEGYLGRGVSKIVNGDIASARRDALEDAKEKVVMEAVCERMSLDDITKYFLTLKNIFIKHPDIYLQSFKIINENALFDSYNVTINGFVQQELFGNDLESMGVAGPARKKLKILIMMAEKGIDSPDEISWWSLNQLTASSQYLSQQKLEKYFAEKGTTVIDHFQIPSNIYSEKIGRSSEPDILEVSQFASWLGAGFVVLGKSSLKKTERQKFSSFMTIQCDMSGKVIDALNSSIIMQASTHALGIQVDEAAAVAEAVDKASMQLSEQITNKIFLNIRNMHEYIFELTFDRQASDREVRGWIDSFHDVFPEIEFTEIKNDIERQLWTVKLNSNIEAAAILQKMFETGYKGYKTEVISVNSNVIRLKIL
jgi:hypothetical protein